MAKKIFTVGDIPIFIEAETVQEALHKIADAMETIVEKGPDVVYEIESEITEVPIEKSKLN